MSSRSILINVCSQLHKFIKILIHSRLWKKSLNIVLCPEDGSSNFTRKVGTTTKLYSISLLRDRKFVLALKYILLVFSHFFCLSLCEVQSRVVMITPVDVLTSTASQVQAKASEEWVETKTPPIPTLPYPTT